MSGNSNWIGDPISTHYQWINRINDAEFHGIRHLIVGPDHYFRYNSCSLVEEQHLAFVWGEVSARLVNMPLVEWSRFNLGQPTNVTATRRYLAAIVEDQQHHNTSSKKLQLATNRSEIDGTVRDTPRTTELPYSWFRAARVWQPLSYAFRMSGEWYLLEIARSRRYWQAVYNRATPTTLHNQEDQHVSVDGPIPTAGNVG